MKSVIAFLTVFALVQVGRPDAVDPIVQIANGPIRGTYNGEYYTFQPIPIAEPTTGENRFESPKALLAKWTEPRNVSGPMPVCIQTDPELNNTLVGQEDCLAVSVETPEISPAAGRLYPVLAFIHGGAFMYGSQNFNQFDSVMKRKDIVVVRFTYRLGAMGFLSTEDDVIAGNFGLKDQLFALKWIQANIRAFNGNPANVTLSGFSAGGASVHLQVLSPHTAGLMQSAIAFSGNAFCPWVMIPKASEVAKKLARFLGCDAETSAAIKKCLQAKPAEEIVRANVQFQPFMNNPFTIYGPVVESRSVKDAFITDQPEAIIKKGLSQGIPILFSYSKEDGGFNAGQLVSKDATTGKVVIDSLNERWTELAPLVLFYKDHMSEEDARKHSTALRQKYLKDTPFSEQSYRQVQQIYTDILFASGAERSVRLHRDYSKAPVYAYVYDNPAPIGLAHLLAKRMDVEFGTVHGDDMYVISNVALRDDYPLRPDEEIIHRKFTQMIWDYATSGELKFGEEKLVANKNDGNKMAILEITKDGEKTKWVESFVHS